MAEINIIEFEYKDVAKALIQYHKITEGHWGVALKLGIQGANISIGEKKDLIPVAIVPILKIGLQRFDEPNNLTVDASKIKPRKTAKK
jgi:hypothetical protein